MKKVILYFVAIVSILIIVASTFGIANSIFLTTGKIKDKNVEKSTSEVAVVKNTVKPKENYYNILVLGDSLAKGTGDENNKGFAGDFADNVKKKTSKKVKLDNLGVNGDVSTGLLEIVRSKNASVLIKNSNIVFISIGGNEITKLRRYDAVSETTEIKPVLDNYLNNLKDIFKTIRQQNQNCRIVFIGLYNPFGDNIGSDKVKLINEWNKETQDVIADDTNSVFIPTYDLFKYNSEKYLTIDKFHPNSNGYEAIAKRICEAIVIGDVK